jgi:hypothetical protein
MKPSTLLKVAAAGALAAAAFAVTSTAPSAQTAASISTTKSPVAPAPASAGNLSMAAVPGRKPSANATPDMINEAIQRSQARAAKLKQRGIPEQFGSEEPFTYNPAVKNFTAAQQ